MALTERGNQSGAAKAPRARWRRPWLLLVVLLPALIGSNLLYALVSQRTITLNGAPGELLYVSDFDGFIDEWDLYDGQQSAAVVDGQLQLSVASPQTATWSSASHYFTEFDLSVEAEAIAGPIDNAFGIVFGIAGQDDRDCGYSAIVLCGLSEWFPLLGAALGQALETGGSRNYFAFLISSDGYYSLMQVRDGEQERLSAWIPSDQIEQGISAFNTIRVVHQWSELRFFVNGEPVTLCLPDYPATTSTYASGECIGGSMRDHLALGDNFTGRLGLIAEATQTGGGGVVVQFDNLIVKSPGYPSSEDSRA